MAKTEGQRFTNMMRKDLIFEEKSMTVALTSCQKDSSRRKRRLTMTQCKEHVRALNYITDKLIIIMD